MSHPITEIVVLTLQPGVRVEELLKDISQILSRQTGFRRFHWGVWKESPEKVQLFIDWDNLKAHQDFEASGVDYTAVGALLGPVLAAAPSMHHAYLTPRKTDSVLTEHVTEIATFYGITPVFESKIGDFLQILSQANGFRGVSGGSVIEDLEFEGTSKKGKAYVIAISWTSVEDHILAMTTRDVKEGLSLIDGEAENIEMHHVHFLLESHVPVL